MIPFPEPPLIEPPPGSPKSAWDAYEREKRRYEREKRRREKKSDFDLKLIASMTGTILALGLIVLLRYEILPAAMAATWAQIINFVAWLALAGVIFAAIWKTMNWLLRD